MSRIRPDILEALFWLSGLAVVAVADPSGEPWIRVCLFDHLGSLVGLEFCPGCGLGRSVGYLVRGDIAASLSMHPLGIPAVGVIAYHATRLLRLPRFIPHSA